MRARILALPVVMAIILGLVFRRLTPKSVGFHALGCWWQPAWTIAMKSQVRVFAKPV
jgi:hypothetical protein